MIFLLTAAVLMLTILLIYEHLGQRSIAKQLRDILGKDTNSTVHACCGASKKLINEINALLKELNAEKTAYLRKKHRLDRMMTNISHDLRTPLTSAMGYMELVRDPELSEDEKCRELNIISSRLETLEKLIDSFFEFSKIISRDEPPALNTLNLVGILEEAAAHAYDDFTAAGRRILLSCEGRIEIVSNEAMLLRIFDNLIANSLKHGTGDLFISADRHSVIFRNAVTGGLPDMERIFDEFYTYDISRTGGNTGLGLAIVRQFTEILGGHISAACSGGEFIIEISDIDRNSQTE